VGALSECCPLTSRPGLGACAPRRAPVGPLRSACLWLRRCLADVALIRLALVPFSGGRSSRASSRCVLPPSPLLRGIADVAGSQGPFGVTSRLRSQVPCDVLSFSFRYQRVRARAPTLDGLRALIDRFAAAQAGGTPVCEGSVCHW
jgi:hypothetical protein